MRRLLAAVCVVAGSVVVPTAGPAEAGGGGCRQADATEGTGSTVETRNACFEPTVLRVEPGTTVTFVNRDGIEHAVSGVNLDSWDQLGAGVTLQYAFDRAGTYPYMCNLHPGMTGVVIVGEGRGAGAGQRVAEPVLAGADRPAPAAGEGVHAAWIAVAALVGVGAGVFLQKRRAARA